MTAGRTRVAVTLLGVLATASACPPPRPEHPETDAQRLLAVVGAAHERARSMRAVARFDAMGTGGRFRGKVYVLVERPARMRFEAMTPFDNPLSILVIDGEDFRLYDIAARRVYEGPGAANCVLAKSIHMPLEAPRAVEALLGGAPLLEHRGETSPRLRWDGGRYRVDLDGVRPGESQTLFLQPVGSEYDLVESEVHARAGDRDSVVRLEFDRWEPVGGVRFPRRIRMEATDRGEDLSVRYDEIELNPALPADSWQIAAPAEVPRRIVHCEDIL